MNNRDFLFLYDAALCNPNGDPDRENKPRLDEVTNTNLVSDVRLKRSVREFWKANGQRIFVDMVGDAKVTMDTRLKGILEEKMADEDFLKKVFAKSPSAERALTELREKHDDTAKLVGAMVNKKTSKEVGQLNMAVQELLVAEDFIDIRAFGSAFAVDGFNRSLTGPIQLGWGYSLNEVFLLDSKTISSIMNDGNSTFGQDWRLRYSLIAFIGTVNARAAEQTGLSTEDLDHFRRGLWHGLAGNPTRSKINQYPKVYLEVSYADGQSNGALGDLRRMIDCRPVEGKSAQQVAGPEDLQLDFSKLVARTEAGRRDGILQDVTLDLSADCPDAWANQLEKLGK